MGDPLRLKVGITRLYRENVRSRRACGRKERRVFLAPEGKETYGWSVVILSPISVKDTFDPLHVAEGVTCGAHPGERAVCPALQ